MKILKSKKIYILLGVVLLLLLNVGVCFNPFDNGGCISVTFDKLPMMLADRAVLCVGEERYEINDLSLVHELTKQTCVATNTDLCCTESGDRYIEIYWGNTLVRRMLWERNHDKIVVYNEGVFHWVLFSQEGDGLVFPSEELIAKLNEVIAASNKVN